MNDVFHDLERTRIVLAVLERLHRLHTPARHRERRQVDAHEQPGPVPGRRPRGDRADTYVSEAYAYVSVRSFTWRQATLRVLQLQIGAMCCGAVLTLITGGYSGALLIVASTLWTALHELVKTRDNRRHAEASRTDPVLLGVLVSGGFGSLPAKVATRLDGDMATPGVVALRDHWYATHDMSPEVREIFEALGCEFDDSVDALYGTSVALAREERVQGGTP